MSQTTKGRDKEFSRRDFLVIFSASIVSLGLNQNKVLDYLADKTPLAKPVIYLGVDSIAFFNIPYPRTKPITTSELRKRRTEYLHWPIKQRVSMYLPPESVYYFRTSPDDNVDVITTIGECIVFGAYTTHPDGRIKSSGVYHAKTLPPSKGFMDKMYFFIDTLRTNPRNPRERLFFKGSGHYGLDSQKEVVKNLEAILKRKELRIEKYSLDLGEMVGKINTFCPRTGELFTGPVLANRE